MKWNKSRSKFGQVSELCALETEISKHLQGGLFDLKFIIALLSLCQCQCVHIAHIASRIGGFPLLLSDWPSFMVEQVCETRCNTPEIGKPGSNTHFDESLTLYPILFDIQSKVTFSSFCYNPKYIFEILINRLSN